MPASQDLVFKKHEYWRLWTTLLAHGDLEHLGNNLMLFLPFSFFLSGYFGLIFFPLIGFYLGGIINGLVLLTMPEETMLIGISGVVYWMGAAWITLTMLIDRRENLSRRLLRALGVSMLLFLPTTYQTNVSYLSHGVGFLLGIISGFILYQLRKSQYENAVVLETHLIQTDFGDWMDEENQEKTS
jgi:rhomboid protease GluP